MYRGWLKLVYTDITATRHTDTHDSGLKIRNITIFYPDRKLFWYAADYPMLESPLEIGLHLYWTAAE